MTIQWTPEMDARLGTVPDQEIADSQGIHQSSVCNRRHRLGVSPFQFISPPIEWTSKIDALLGTISDQKVADELGVSQRSVQRRREELGITSWAERNSLEDTPELIALLGTMFDRELAERLGVSRLTISGHRRRLGIPAFRPRVTWTLQIDALLGTMSDRVLGRRIGTTGTAVRCRRLKLGVPSWGEQNRILPRDLTVYDPGARRIFRYRRKHRERGTLNTLTVAQWRFACEWFDNKCAYCGAKVFLTEDHLVPVSKGGPRTALNIIPACSHCNSLKWATPAHLWIYQKFGMVEGKKIMERIVEYLTLVKVKE